MPSHNSNIPTKLIYAALRRLLRPLVKLLVGHGVIFPALAELLRELYVEVASSDFVVEGKGQTLSRINLMTGVTRREVRRLLDQKREPDAAPLSLSLSARIISVWLGDEQYLDDQQRPLPLPLTAPDDGPSMEKLVSSVSKDVRGRAVLDEWLRQGIVSMSGYVVSLRETAFIPTHGFDEKVYYFSRNLRDHIAAGVHNLEEGSTPFFDRAVYYDQLSAGSVEELRGFVHEHGVAFMLEINRKARALADRDEARGGRRQGRITLGAYFYAEEEEAIQRQEASQD
ncbi:MAG: DUF6502 family protein [Geminicoccaceae bacterium]